MDTRTVRQTSVTLPNLDDTDLDEVDSLEGEHGKLRDFRYLDAHLREPPLSGTQLMDGRVTGLTTQRARLDELRLNSVEFSDCDLSGLRWEDSKLSRVTFTNCKMLGAEWENVTLDDVVFERCKLDYATVTHLRAVGRVIFTGCSLREARFVGSDLSDVAFDECDLHLTEFDGGTYRGCDLRGNDLSGLRGVSALRKIIVDQPQLQGLAQALAAELEVSFG
ncbi:pentapeptide repeat-containing protein [Streptosporangium sp. NBC_01755]|uniref:pentapeptide repeat-containing protein n=1 Tax=unclassified Streptosporangium TaxID=2632669 RepID=UPI002DDA2A92|nr:MULTISPECIES: pentapeptide repeat-containing protein [unclassified Streptosporangium]WSA26222.1 pentapeptide repeat-containing protein [Streptosporangium sp. NBC_01810]WSD02350.1 pentapeptide repeat-containing protein [Streptosporangium sp. NBC_01755]